MGELEVVKGKVFDVIGVQDVVIQEMNQRALAITIKGIEDKENLKECHDLRMVYVKQRNAVMKHGKGMREEAVRYSRDVIAEEKRIIDMMLIGETHLDTQEQAVKDELARIKAEEQRLEDLRIQSRRDRLALLGVFSNGLTWKYGSQELPDAVLRISADGRFEELYEQFKKEIEADIALKTAEEAKRKEEAERMAKVAAEQEAEKLRLEAMAKEQTERLAKIEAEEKRMAAEKQRLIDEEAARVKKEADAKQKVIDDKRRADELEAARKEGEERARLQAIEDAKRAEAEKVEKERAAAEKEAKRIARMPDKQRLLAFANNDFFVPNMSTPEGQRIIATFKDGLKELLFALKKGAELL